MNATPSAQIAAAPQTPPAPELPLPNAAAAAAPAPPALRPGDSPAQRREAFLARHEAGKHSSLFEFKPADIPLQHTASAHAPASLMHDPDFVAQATKTLLGIAGQMPKLAAALGAAQLPLWPERDAAASSQLGAYLGALILHLPALTAARGAALQSPGVSPQKPVARGSSADQAFCKTVSSEAAAVIKDPFGPLLMTVQKAAEKSQRRRSMTFAAQNPISVAFANICVKLEEARKHAAKGDAGEARQALAQSLIAIDEFKQKHLPVIARHLSGSDSALPGAAEHEFRRQLRSLRSRISGWLDPEDALRERACSSPLSPEKREAAAETAAAESTAAPQKPQAENKSPRKRFLSSGARSPSKFKHPAEHRRRDSADPAPPSPLGATASTSSTLSRSSGGSADPLAAAAPETADMQARPGSPRPVRSILNFSTDSPEKEKRRKRDQNDG
jgi:hypothetical protein